MKLLQFENMRPVENQFVNNDYRRDSSLLRGHSIQERVDDRGYEKLYKKMDIVFSEKK